MAAAQRNVNAIRYGVVAIQVVAMGILVWSFILGVKLAVDSSVVGGLAVMLIAAIMLAVVGWRVKFRWTQLRAERT